MQLPDDDNEEYDGPQIYEQAELQPLLPADQEMDQQTTQPAHTATANGGTADPSTDEPAESGAERTASSEDEETEPEHEETSFL
jgi:hypothetical protein